MRPPPPAQNINHKKKTRDSTTFKLICIEGKDWEQDLATGDSIVIEDHVQLHLADQAGNALIEITPLSQKSGSLVIVGEQVVHDFSHLRTHQILRINDLAFVLLPPRAVYINHRPRSLRLPHLVSGLASASPALGRKIEKPNLRPSATKDAPSPKKRRKDSASDASYSAQRIFGQQSQATPPLHLTDVQDGHRKTRNSFVWPFAICLVGLAGLGFALIPAENAPTSSVTSSAATTSTMIDSSQPLTPTASPSLLASNAAPASSAPSASESSARSADILYQVPGQEVKDEGSNPDSSSVQVKWPAAKINSQPSAPIAPKPVPQRKITRKAPLKAKIASPSPPPLDPAEAASIRNLIGSYKLESGFDPEGVRVKLRALRSHASGDTALLREIDKALDSIKE